MKEAVFQIGPFDRNLAQAIGSALRRYALGCVKGTAVTGVRIPGVTHEYMRLDGVRENALRIIENLRGLVIRGTAEQAVVLRLARNGLGQATAGDFCPADGLSFPEPTQPVAALVEGLSPAGFVLEAEVSTGIGYRSAEENRRSGHGPDTIPVASSFSPVIRAWCELGEGETAAAKLAIRTDGSISPEEVLREASAALVADLQSPIESAEFGEAAGEFRSRCFGQTRASTLANLIEAAVIFDGEAEALDSVDLSSTLEAGDFLDNPNDERFVLSIRVTRGASPQERLDRALSGLRTRIEDATSRATASAEPVPALPITGVSTQGEVRKFEQIASAVEFGDPLAIQRDSLKRFLAREPEDWNLDWLLHRSLTVDCGENGKLELVDWSLGEAEGDPASAKRAGGAYAAPLQVKVRVIRPDGELLEQQVVLAELPMMTPRASFVIKGRERVCINQLLQAPGVYFEYEPRYDSYRATIFPHHGRTLTVDFGRDGIARARFGGRRPVDAEALLRAFGWSGTAKDLGLRPDMFRSGRPLSTEEAREVVGRSLWPDAEDVEAALTNTLRDELAYSLSELGRERINHRLGVSGSGQFLELEDVLGVLRKLTELQGEKDEIDDLPHAKNLVARSVGESLFTHVHLGFQKMRRALAAWLCGQAGDRDPELDEEPERVGLAEFLTGRMQEVLDEFFLHNSLVRDLNTTSNLAMLTQVRQITRSGPGGLDKKRADLAPRYVHPSHYGRLCVIDTPEGDNIGLLRSLSMYARIDDHGAILVPYLRVAQGKVTGEVTYLSAEEEDRHVLAPGDAARDAAGKLTAEKLLARKGIDYVEVSPEEVEFVGASPHEILGAPGHAIPFIEFDDPNRALMGANMSRQAVRLLRPEPPVVATGYEEALAEPVVCEELNWPGSCLDVRIENRSITDTLAAALSPGRNLLVGIVPWEGYNYEDGFVISEKVIREGAFTSVHPREFTTEIREFPEGADRLTNDVPGVERELLLHLDENGIARVGAEVESGDILVGKTRHGPLGDVEDASLRLPEGCRGRVLEVEVRNHRGGFELPVGVQERVRVTVAVERVLKVGDKLASRHGSKGVVAKIVADEDMPCLADGTPIEMAISPLGIPSRMNIGQLMEAHLSLAARALGIRAISPPLNGARPEDVQGLLKEAGLPEDGRLQLFDGRTGKPFDQRSTVGLIYWRKLIHMVDDAFQARSVGDYDPRTQQPVAGRKRHGGQKVGKMEIWALQAHGAAYNLREFLSIKADDAIGREGAYEAIVLGQQEEAFRAPESANLLLRELRGAGLDARYCVDGQPVDVDQPYDVNEVDEACIAFATPDTIRGWSSGEVVSETSFNEDTGEPSPGGLFCERIFGPLQANRCACGERPAEAEAPEVCEECGVALDPQARFRRMGHIELAVPVLHPWIRAIEPSPLRALTGLNRDGLDDVIYYRRHVVVAPKNSDLERGQLLDDEEYRGAREKFGYEFQALMGAEAVCKLVESADLEKARSELLDVADPEDRSEAVEVAALLETFAKSNGSGFPGILEAIPVLPAGLRPSVQVRGQTATSDLNELYERVVRRSVRLRTLIAMKTPDIMLRDEQRLLQEAVNALLGNGYRGHSLRGSREVTLAALSDRLKGPKGRFIQCLAGKRTDYSARTVIAPGTSLKLDECAVPKELALELFRPFVVGELLRSRQATSRSHAERLVDRQRQEAYRTLRSVVKGKVILIVRAPSLHKYSMLAFRPLLTNERTIRIHPNVTIGFNADFDGDQMTVHVPLSEAAHEEAQRLLMAPRNLFGTGTSAMMNRPSQEIILGCYYMTLARDGAKGEGQTFGSVLAVRNAWKGGRVDSHAQVRVKLEGGAEVETTVGRVLFNEMLPTELRFVNEPVGGQQLQGIIADCYVRRGVERTAELVDAIKEFGFHFSTVSGISIWRSEPCREREAFFAEMDAELGKLRSQRESGEISEEDRYLKTIDLWSGSQARLREAVVTELSERDGGFSPTSLMVRSGARGNQQQMLLVHGAGGLLADMFGRIIEFPIRECMMTGNGQMSYFLKANSARAGLAMTSLRTAPAGDLMRRVVEALEDVMVVEEDCGTARGFEMASGETEAHLGQSLAERAAGRVPAEGIRNASGAVLFPAGQELTAETIPELLNSGMTHLRVRSPITCESRGGICAKCYGHDLGQKRAVEVGAAVGMTAALSLGEPLTQMTMRSFHLGHRYPYSHIARGRPEQDLKYSSGFPRLEEVFEMFEKRRAFGPALDGVDERPSPQSVLDQQGEEAARQYLLGELMHVYADSGVRVNSKHYEIAVRQMMSFAEVEDPGGTSLMAGQRIGREELAAINEETEKRGQQPATAEPVLMPITEVALRTGSFLAASASWQTVSVLTKAALRGDTDCLKGMRENIILGRLIPMGGRE